MDPEPTIEFRLDRTSGVPAYRQLVDQVRQALQLGILRPGDQLPTVRDVVRQIAIKNIGRDEPTLLITNDLATPAHHLFGRYAERMMAALRLAVAMMACATGLDMSNRSPG